MQDSVKADVGWLNDIPIVFKLSDQVLERLKLTLREDEFKVGGDFLSLNNLLKYLL